MLPDNLLFKPNHSVLSRQLQQLSTAVDELLLQHRIQCADDYFATNSEGDLRRCGFTDRPGNMLIDGVTDRNKAEKSPAILRTEVKWLRRYLVDPVIEGQAAPARQACAVQAPSSWPHPERSSAGPRL